MEQPDGRLSKTWEVAMRGTDGDWDTTELHSYDHTPEVDPELFITQAPPKKIYTTRRTRPEREEEIYLFYGDTHHPFQDERALDLAQLAIKELAPNIVTFLGDDNDMSMFSRFETRQEWRDSTQQGIDQFSERLAKVRSDVGKDAVIYALQGNHDKRLEKQLRNYNGELLGLKQAGSELAILTMDFLLNCGELQVSYISGYPEAEVWYGNNTKGFHGRRTSSTGAIVAQEIKQETVNTIHGHGHSNQYVERTFRDARELRTIWALQVGAFASQETPSGAFSQNNQGEVLRQAQNWQPGLWYIIDHGETQTAHQIPITNDGIVLNNRLYKS